MGTVPEEMEDAKPAYICHLERKVRPNKGAVETFKTKLHNQVSCSVPKAKRTLTDFFPVLLWLPKYKIKEYVWGDVMSGLIVGIILVPQAIAYCLLAGLEPIYGLYTSFFANIIYFFLGTSKHVSVGIFSLMSLMVGQVVYREVYLAGFDMSEDSKKSTSDAGWNGTEDFAVNLTVRAFGMECGKECYAISIATALTFLAGIYQVFPFSRSHKHIQMSYLPHYWETVICYLILSFRSLCLCSDLGLFQFISLLQCWTASPLVPHSPS